MALCNSAAEYIGKVELHAITIEDPAERVNFYSVAVKNEMMAGELNPDQFGTVTTYFGQRMNEQKALISLRSNKKRTQEHLAELLKTVGSITEAERRDEEIERRL